MKEIVGLWSGAGNSRRGLVRSYVLYFERLAGWTVERQVAPVEPVRKDGPPCRRKGASQMETHGAAKKRQNCGRQQKRSPVTRNLAVASRTFGERGRGCRTASCCTSGGRCFLCGRENAGCSFRTGAGD